MVSPMPDPKNEPLWYCIKTKPRLEQTARRWIQAEAGLEVFCPLIRFERARRTGKVRVTEAMFPGYVFARFVYFESHRRVAAANGVATIVSFGGLPAVVPEQVVSELRLAVANDGLIEIPSVVNPGDEVDVIDGPFKGIRALVTRVMPARERVHVLLEILGIEREIEMSNDHVLPCVDHPLTAG